MSIHTAAAIDTELLTLGSIKDPPGLNVRKLLTEFAILLGVPPWVSFLAHPLAKGVTQSLSLIFVSAEVQRSGIHSS